MAFSLTKVIDIVLSGTPTVTPNVKSVKLIFVDGVPDGNEVEYNVAYPVEEPVSYSTLYGPGDVPVVILTL